MVQLTVSDADFHDLIAKRAQHLLYLASRLSTCKSRNELMVRPFLGELLSQSMQIEELLDAYDARNNRQWCSFRSLTAAIKLFSDVGYELLHIQHALPAYRLLPIEHDFVKSTEDALGFAGQVLVRAAGQMLTRSCRLGLPIPSGAEVEESYREELPSGRLPHDCGTRRTKKGSETVALLSTAFLNLAAESRDVRAASGARPQEYESYASGSASEEKLRNLQLRFHNLQSLYDTHVSGSETEDMDPDLLVLRGHISVVLHLLKTATLLAHYYERHVQKQRCESPAGTNPLVEPEKLLGMLMKYAIAHIGLYIDCAERLCQDMLKRYAEVGEIEVSVPRYRGFHVRPCTLIAKLVLHYGSEVEMRMDNDVYDAGSPLELFRANEKINARKRRWLAAEIAAQHIIKEHADDPDIKSVVRALILALAEQGKIILYEQPVQIPEEPARREGKTLEKVIDEMSRLLAMGKIDIDAKLTASFRGDMRVLADIKLLAECGYGEDNFGNNVPLPDKLVYLRR